MMKLEVLENGKEVVITSVRLVDIINEFRELESNITGKKKAKLRHSDFMTKVKKELEVLQSLGLGGQRNISQSSYINSQNKKQPCYSLNRDGMLQMLNSESTIVRAKTIEYINKLEQEVVELEVDNKELHQIAVSDEELKLREYKADCVRYSWKRIRPLLEQCTYKDIEEEVDNIIDFHTERLKKKDRCNYDTHTKANNTEYKQIVREHIYTILDSIYDNSRDSLLTMVVSNVKEELIKQRLATTNRSVGKIISNQENKIDEIEGYLRTFNPSIAEYNKIDCHGFSCNSTLQAVTDYNTGKPRVVNSNGYKNWIERFPNHQFKDYDEIDFNKKVYIWLKWDCLERFDAGDNFIKTFKDQLCRYHNVDDRNIMIMRSDVNKYVDSYDEGKIYYILKQGK